MLETYIAEYYPLWMEQNHLPPKPKTIKTTKNNNKTKQLPADCMLEMSLMYDAT